MLEFVLLCAYGKFFIFAFQKFPLTRKVKNEFFRELFGCQFCLGVWIFSVLSWLLHVVLFKDVVYFPVVSEIFTGVFTSFLMNMITIGFWEWFGRIEIGGG